MFYLLGDVRPRERHGDTHVRALESGGVVHPVPGDAHDMAERLCCVSEGAHTSKPKEREEQQKRRRRTRRSVGGKEQEKERRRRLQEEKEQGTKKKVVKQNSGTSTGVSQPSASFDHLTVPCQELHTYISSGAPSQRLFLSVLLTIYLDKIKRRAVTGTTGQRRTKQGWGSHKTSTPFAVILSSPLLSPGIE